MTADKKELYIEICMGQEKYAARIQEIQEIIKWQEITKIPRMISHVEGIIHLRGKVVPIMSLAKRLGLREERPIKSTRIIIINNEDEVVGLIVDGVNQVMAIGEIQPHMEMGRDLDSTAIMGYGRTETGFVCILSLEQLFRK